MNVYDFDKTIYDGDSTLEYYFFCVKRYPAVLCCVPQQLYGLLKYKVGIIDKTQFKEEFYCFLYKIKNIDETIKAFWDSNQYKIKDWYKMQQKSDDLVISASPEFLLNEICRRLNIRLLLASQVNQKTGLFSGKNCYGEEKVNRFYQMFPDVKIDNFYSDSDSDLPMAKIAEQAYIVKKNEIIPWRV